MQADVKWLLISLVFMVCMMGGTAVFPGLRVLVIPVLFAFIIALVFWWARPGSED